MCVSFSRREHFRWNTCATRFSENIKYRNKNQNTKITTESSLTNKHP